MEKKNLDTNEALKAYAKAEFDKVDLDKKGFISTSDFADIRRQRTGVTLLCSALHNSEYQDLVVFLLIQKAGLLACSVHTGRLPVCTVTEVLLPGL